MTPEYLYELADIADPDQLWRLPGMTQLDLPSALRRQLDTGVALRRYAAHIGRLELLRREGKSLLITPLSPNGSALKTVDNPPEHKRPIGQLHKEQTLQRLAKRYHDACEAYDRTVCTGPVVEGSIMPISPEEFRLVNKNAQRVLRQLQEEATLEGINHKELYKAIGDAS